VADRLPHALEAVLLVVDTPVGAADLAVAVEQPVGAVEEALQRLATEYDEAERGIQLREVAGGWRLYTREEYAGSVERLLLEGQRSRLTQAALETLAVVAYRQPVTRSVVERIRGVDSDYVLRGLLHRRLVAEQGRAEAPGRPILYGTSMDFLERFGLMSLDDLPHLEAEMAGRLADEGEAPPDDALDPEDRAQADHA
jgi:segregation and condensation protein B